MFQATVSQNIGFGIVGEIALDGPMRAQPARLVSADAAYNVFGRAFTTTADGSASFNTSTNPNPITAGAGGAGAFAGILAEPKAHVLAGTVAGGTLAPSLTLPNNTLVTLVQECAGLIVTLPAAFAVGDWIWYDTTTGVLQSTAPAASAPAGTARVPNARVVRYGSAAAGLAVIEISARA